MSQKYKGTYRGYLIDHHSPDPPIITFNNLAIEDYIDFYHKANINNLMVYCKDHWGKTYYPSAYGPMHPGLKRDWIKEVKEALNSKGIEFNAYYSVEYDEYIARYKEEWTVRKSNGDIRRCESPTAKWGMACYESPYGDYLVNQLKEIVTGYEPDSLFLDIFGKSLCYCPSCLSAFEKSYGYPLPDEKEYSKEEAKHMNQFLIESAYNFLFRIKKELRQLQPDLAITINFASLYPASIRSLLDYQFTEPWSGNWLSAAYARDTACNQYPQLGAGDVSEVYNYQHINKYKLAAAQISAGDCRVFMYSGSQHPDGTLEMEEAVRIGEAYKDVEGYEDELVHREVLADIGIMLTESQAKDEEVVANAISRCKQGSIHRQSIKGAMELCDNTKWGWKVVTESSLRDDLKVLKVLLLTQIEFTSREFYSLLKEYIENGGIILMDSSVDISDEDGNAFLESVVGISRYLDLDDRGTNPWQGYLQWQSNVLKEKMDRTTPPIAAYKWRVDAHKGQVLATIQSPVEKLSDTSWVNWWSPPPDQKLSNQVSMILTLLGAGKVVYFNFEFFKMSNKTYTWMDAFFSCLLHEQLRVEPIYYLETSYKHIIQCQCYQRHREWIFHYVSNAAEHYAGDIPSIDPGILHLYKGTDGPEKVELIYPEKGILEVHVENENHYSIQLPPVTIHCIVKIYWN